MAEPAVTTQWGRLLNAAWVRPLLFLVLIVVAWDLSIRIFHIPAYQIPAPADVVAVLTGNVMKDPDYIYKYHTDRLEAPDGSKIASTFGNQAIVVPNDADKIANLLK